MMAGGTGTASASFGYAISHYVCPSIGAVLANVTIFVPANSLRNAIVRGQLGHLNPVPFAILTGNTLGWTVYAYLKKDIFIALANSPGLFFSIWLNAGAIKLQYLESQRKELSKVYIGENLERVSLFSSSNTPLALEPRLSLPPIEEKEGIVNTSFNEPPPDNIEVQLPIFSKQEIILLATMFVWLVLFSVIGLSTFTRDTMIEIVGIFVNVNLVLFFAAPLITIREVIQTNDSSSIHRPLMIAMILMSAFWTIYGFAISDVFVVVPNACGFLLGLLQTLLCFTYPNQDIH